MVDLVTLDHISFGNKGEEVLRTKLTKSNATDLEVDFDEVIKARELMVCDCLLLYVGCINVLSNKLKIYFFFFL